MKWEVFDASAACNEPTFSVFKGNMEHGRYASKERADAVAEYLNLEDKGKALLGQFAMQLAQVARDNPTLTTLEVIKKTLDL